MALFPITTNGRLAGAVLLSSIAIVRCSSNPADPPTADAGGTGEGVCTADGWCWQTPSAQSSALTSVWVRSASDVFAVGARGTILRYDGSQWRAMVSGTKHDLRAVWGSAATDVFAVGASGAILHFDGTRWDVSVNAGAPAYWNALSSVWGSSATDVFAVGDLGTILHYDGTSWKLSPKDDDVASDEGLSSVWGTSATDVFAVSIEGTLLHYDGTRWKTLASRAASSLWGVWAGSAKNVFAVGGDCVAWELTDTCKGVVLHYDGNGWHAVASSTTRLESVWGSSASDVVAVGLGGAILHYDGLGWRTLASGAARSLAGVSGTARGDAFVVGEWATILHRRGAIGDVTDHQ